MMSGSAGRGRGWGGGDTGLPEEVAWRKRDEAGRGRLLMGGRWSHWPLSVRRGRVLGILVYCTLRGRGRAPGLRAVCAGPVCVPWFRWAANMAASTWMRAVLLFLCASDLLLFPPPGACAADTPGEATPPPRKKKKDIRDYNDADMARLLEQWEVRAALTHGQVSI